MFVKVFLNVNQFGKIWVRAQKITTIGRKQKEGLRNKELIIYYVRLTAIDDTGHEPARQPLHR